MSIKDLPNISNSNTKAEILKAYDEALKMLKEKSAAPVVVQARQEERQQVERAAKIVAGDDIFNGVAALKSMLTSSLDKTADAIRAEGEKLKNIQQAIVLEQKRLDETYGIKAEAESLAALVESQQAAKLGHAQAMRENEESWQQKIDKLESSFKEEKAAQDKARTREDEEYQYNLTQQRRKNADENTIKQQQLEKEWAEKTAELTSRETVLSQQENDIEKLRQQAEQFEQQLENAVIAAKETQAETLGQQHQFDLKLLKQETAARSACWNNRYRH